ncbi:DNA polymerase III subunit tau [bacterium BMS3Abin15]|nr:DNA polymerase III subunit tau [bacterium BMS3Abin15]HDZ85956.1 DNA polymerase III subunit gamma/tau [Candidatus Moranbacteria bacterium]
MSNTLYRKYRPQKFSEIIGQQHIIRTLTNAIKNDRIGHAYLFTGPRGTGKTTVARILAKAVNCQKLKDSDPSRQRLAEAEPCLKCDICKNISGGQLLDIIEIDAASHTGVDNIRELKETVKLPPTQAKYKVYIIDEAHMLSTGAFNALLKTLEEPPAHVIFILATTAIHKIPETILSRCQRFDFVRLPLENIIKKLSLIAKSEGIKIDKNSLEMIALAAEGGMRDAESLLSQIMALEDKNITSKEVEEILGTADRQVVEDTASALLEKNVSLALSLINKLFEDGYDLEVFSKSLLNYLRQLMLVSIDPELSKNFSFELTPEQTEKLKELSQKSTTEEILKIIDSIAENQNKIKSSFIAQLPLEIAIVKAVNHENIKTQEHKNIKIKGPLLPKGEDVRRTDEGKKEINKQSDKVPKKSISNTRSSDSDISIDDVKDNWNKLLEDIRPHNHSLNALLLNCQPASVESNVVKIAVKYSFYKDKLNEEQNKLTIEKVLGNILNSDVRIKALSEEEAGVKIVTNPPATPERSDGGRGNPQPKTDNKKEDNSLLDDAMKIMGGRLVGDSEEPK